VRNAKKTEKKGWVICPEDVSALCKHPPNLTIKENAEGNILTLRFLGKLAGRSRRPRMLKNKCDLGQNSIKRKGMGEKRGSY
jgi:hypothetical protein